jgi:hypothetical protein
MEHGLMEHEPGCIWAMSIWYSAFNSPGSYPLMPDWSHSPCWVQADTPRGSTTTTNCFAEASRNSGNTIMTHSFCKCNLAGNMAQVVQHLPKMHKTLGFTPGTTKTNKQINKIKWNLFLARMVHRKWLLDQDAELAWCDSSLLPNQSWRKENMDQRN